MQPGDRIQKSASGREALATRNPQLTAPLRTLLLMVYGDKTAAECEELAARLPAGRDGLQQLADLGLVEVVTPPADTMEPPQTVLPVLVAAAEPPIMPMRDAVPPPASISLDEPVRFRLLHAELERAVASLGLRGVMLQAQVERATSATELSDVREQIEVAIAKFQGKTARREFADRVSALLSR